MSRQTVEVDYLVVGAGAVGMAFADSLFTETQASLAIVDRRHRPGGHWNDAYPFVRLHQPSANYGVNSRTLGSGERDAAGLNQGLCELASGAEVVSYFDQVMRRQFLPSGRVQYFPSSTFEDGTITGVLSGDARAVRAGKIVDARYLPTAVPAMRARGFEVAEEAICEPLNELPRLAHLDADYVVIGAGKTGMDACLYLLENGTDPDRIRWITPRDAWLIDRVNFQVDDDSFARSAKSVADQVEAIAQASSIPDVFRRLEACGELLRLDPAVAPTAYHCATVTRAELTQLRRIRNVVRMGRVQRIEPHRIVLQQGEIPTSTRTLHVDCSASALARPPPRPVFDGEKITLQPVRTCQPTFSGAFVGHVEAAYATDDEKNHLCQPIPYPDRDIDYLKMAVLELANRVTWSQDPAIGNWLATARLDGFTARARRLLETDAEARAHIGRYAANVGSAAARMEVLLAAAA